MDFKLAETASLPDALPPCRCDDNKAPGDRASDRWQCRWPKERPCPAKYTQLLRTSLQHNHYSAVLHLVDLFACSGVEPPHAVLYTTFRDILHLGELSSASAWAKYLHSFHDQLVIARTAFKRTLLRHPSALLHVFSNSYDHKRADDDVCADYAVTKLCPRTPAARSSRAAVEPDVRLWMFVTRGLALRKEAAAGRASSFETSDAAASDSSADLDDLFLLPVQKPGVGKRKTTPGSDDVFSLPAKTTKTGNRKNKAVTRKEDYGILLLELAADMVEVDLKLNKSSLSDCLLVQSLPVGDGSLPLTKLGRTLRDLLGYLRMENTPLDVFMHVHRILQAMAALAESNVICERTMYIELAFELKTLPVGSLTRFIETLPNVVMKIKVLDHLMPMICISAASAKERQENASIAKLIRIYLSSAPVKPKRTTGGSASSKDEPVLRMLSVLAVLVNALVEVAASEGISVSDKDSLKDLRTQFRKFESAVERALGESVVKRTRYSPRKKRASGKKDKEAGVEGEGRTERLAVLLEIMNAALESLR